MDNTNARLSIALAKTLVRGSEAFNSELKRKIKVALSEMQRNFSEADFERQIAIPGLVTLTMSGVDFWLFVH